MSASVQSHSNMSPFITSIGEKGNPAALHFAFSYLAISVAQFARFFKYSTPLHAFKNGKFKDAIA